MNELFPHNEAERLAAIRRYDILDTPPDGAFDRITALAARLFHVPICIVSIVDHDRIWFKSHRGVDVDQIDREPGLCASAILQNDPWVVTDARTDPRTLTNALVRGELGLQFYAGIPLVTHDGYNLGTLNIIDVEPREMTEEALETLKDLAALVVSELELRLSALRLVESVAKRRRNGIEVNDNVVQDLVVAKMAIEMGEVDQASAVIDSALSAAKLIASELLSQEDGMVVRPGDLVRDQAAGPASTRDPAKAVD